MRLTAAGILVLTIGGKAHQYRLAAVPAEGGRDFRLEKVPAGDAYTVVLSPMGRHTCTCPGHTRRGVCKHRDALVALAAAGRLPGFAAG